MRSTLRLFLGRVLAAYGQLGKGKAFEIDLLKILLPPQHPVGILPLQQVAAAGSELPWK